MIDQRRTKPIGTDWPQVVFKDDGYKARQRYLAEYVKSQKEPDQGLVLKQVRIEPLLTYPYGGFPETETDKAVEKPKAQIVEAPKRQLPELDFSDVEDMERRIREQEEKAAALRIGGGSWEDKITKYLGGLSIAMLAAALIVGLAILVMPRG